MMENLITLARPYAKAAYEFAFSHQQLEGWLKALQLSAFIMSNAEVIAIVKDPEVDAEQIVLLFSDLLKKELDAPMINFIRLLIRHHRLLLLPAISVHFLMLYQSHKNLAEAAVHSTFELTKAQKTKLMGALEKRFNKTIELTCDVDSSLLGGLVIRVGDRVFDGSGRYRLNRLQETLRGQSQ